MKKIAATILALVLCFLTAVPAFAVNGGVAEPISSGSDLAGTTGINELIYLVPDPSNAQIDLGGCNFTQIVSTTDQVVELATSNPQAAIVIDASAQETLEEEKIFQLARTQHIVLLQGYTEPAEIDEERLSVIQKNTPASMKTDLGNTCFSAYYVVPEEEDIVFWSALENPSPTINELFSFAVQAGDELDNIYQLIYDTPPAKAEYEAGELVIPEKISVSPAPASTLSDWDSDVNHLVKIFRSAISYVSSLEFYDKANGDRVMTISEGEAVLFTGNTKIVGQHTWHEVRAWRIISPNVYYVEGWVRNFYSNGSSSAFLGPCCENLRVTAYDHANDDTIFYTSGRGGYKLRYTSKLYDSSARLLKTLRPGAIVWFTDDEGYSGYSHREYVSISGYTEADDDRYVPVTQTTFIDASFDTGTSSSYSFYTE